MSTPFEPCGQRFGPLCPMRRAQSWMEETQVYMSDDGGADIGRRIDAETRVERSYNLSYRCTSKCEGLKALREECKRWRVTE